MALYRGNRNPQIEGRQTTHLPKDKGRKDKQRSTNYVLSDGLRSPT